MNQVLVFCGAFNPPTKAHIELADYARKETGMDGVVFVPSKMSYIAGFQHKSFAFSDAERLAMLQRIAVDHDWMIVSGHELKQKEQARSYTTLCWLREQGYACKLLMGSDKLPELKDGWLYIPEIMQEFGVVCMGRANEDVRSMVAGDAYLAQFADCITPIVTPSAWQDVSSTKVRELFVTAKEAVGEMEDLLPVELRGLRDYL